MAVVHSESIVAPMHPHLKCAVQSIKPGRICSRLPVAALLQEAATSGGLSSSPAAVSFSGNPVKGLQDGSLVTKGGRAHLREGCGGAVGCRQHISGRGCQVRRILRAARAPSADALCRVVQQLCSLSCREGRPGIPKGGGGP